MNSFDDFYAQCYDSIHASKTYAEEAQQILDLWSQYSDASPAMKILDFGAGTGNHANEFINNGYKNVYCYEPSLGMRRVLTRKFPHISLLEKSDQKSDYFDLVISLFDVLSYQINQNELENYLLEISQLANKGAIILIDSWNASGVALSKPEFRERSFYIDNTEYTRFVRPKFGGGKNLYDLDIEIRKTATAELKYLNTHKMRAYNPDDLKVTLNRYGMEVIGIRNAANYRKSLISEDWRFIFIIRKK